MSNYDPDLQKRKDTAAAAKRTLLQKFKAAAEDPKIAQRQAGRMAINEARVVRRAEREVLPSGILHKCAIDRRKRRR
jgi:hypothetical protein